MKVLGEAIGGMVLAVFGMLAALELFDAVFRSDDAEGLHLLAAMGCLAVARVIWVLEELISRQNVFKFRFRFHQENGLFAALLDNDISDGDDDEHGDQIEETESYV